MDKDYQRVQRWRSNHRREYNDYMRGYRRSGMPTEKEFLEQPEEMWFRKDARRRAVLKQATPSWTTISEIRRVYEECFRRRPNRAVPLLVGYQVPLAHPRVCGLHVGVNLRIMSESYHRRAGRKFRGGFREKAERDQMEWLRKRGLACNP